MTSLTTRQFGLWDSPISATSLAEQLRLGAAYFDSDGQTLVWLEGRSGRGVLSAKSDLREARRELTGDLSVRAEVGYGGGDFTVQGGWVYFAVQRTGRLYRRPLTAGPAVAITPPVGQASSPVVSPDGRWVVYVHHENGVDRLAIVDATGKGWPQILESGRDFYMQPRFSPDGRSVAWIAWDHPNMPWDGTQLYVAPLATDHPGPPGLGVTQRIAGGADVAIFQPEFSPDGRTLLYISDETGWGRIAAYDLASGQQRWLTPEAVEYGQPAWLQDMRSFAVTGDGAIVALRSDRGFHRVERIDPASGETTRIDALAAYTEVAHIAAAPGLDRIVLTGSGPTQSPRVVLHELTDGATHVIARSSGETIAQRAVANCEAVSWNSAGGEQAHGLFYPPTSDRFTGSGKPPLLVHIHGGPTSQARAGWKADVQFFATRGYAVLLVNHRGGTGYGREFMLKLRGNWGVVDVEDAVSGARHLIDSGKVDGDRTVIMGGSAGGFTVLETMCQHPEAFTAGVCLYGVADQFHLAAETHKFELHYLDTLLGPLPEASQVYRERSPVFHAERIKRPMAVFQGADDKVVPQAQSDSIVEALRRNGTPHLYHIYEGEGHGWRKRETIEHFYNAVDGFLRKHVIFT